MAHTKIAHLSDTHLGKRQYGPDGRPDDGLTAFERAITVAVEHDVDAVVHTGDLFADRQPTPSMVARCTNALGPLGEREIPLYTIMGNLDRRNDERWLDFVRRTNTVNRLGREPTLVGKTAFYGIDAVPLGDWETADFSLERPPAGVDCTILCLHELLEPPGDEVTADYPVEEVLGRVDIEIDGLALGGYHQPVSGRVDGTDIWYAGATNRSGTMWAVPGVVQLVEIDDGASIVRQQRDLEPRPVVAATIAFDRGEDGTRVREVLDRHDCTDAVVNIELVDENGVTADQVTRLAQDVGAAVVHVDDNRTHVDCAAGDRATEVRPIARNAVETAALRGFRQRWDRVDRDGAAKRDADSDVERHADSDTEPDAGSDAERHGDSDVERDADCVAERHGDSGAELFDESDGRRDEPRTRTRRTTAQSHDRRT